MELRQSLPGGPHSRLPSHLLSSQGSQSCPEGPRGSRQGWGLQARGRRHENCFSEQNSSQLSCSLSRFTLQKHCYDAGKSHWFHLKLFPNRIWTLKQILSPWQLLYAGVSCKCRVARRALWSREHGGVAQDPRGWWHGALCIPAFQEFDSFPHASPGPLAHLTSSPVISIIGIEFSLLLFL